MKYQKLLYFLQNVGKDPAALVFEDELTSLNNRRFLLSHLTNRINWDSLEKNPVSLLMIDIDGFRQINDQYGRNAGDQALKHIARIFEATAVDDDIAVRYAGDEFVLLLPGRQKSAAVAFADLLLSMIRETGFFLPDAGKQIPLTVSIGVATAPDDAGNGKLLIDQADTALYHAKNSGRNQYADAATVSRQAIRSVDNAGIVGRKSQFEQVSSSFKKISTGQNQFIIIDGAPGMGKTSFLGTVQHNLEKNKFHPVRISGVIQESFRPYYLISYAMMVLMNQLEDSGISILEEMDKAELARLSCIMPQLADDEATLPEDGFENTDALLKIISRFLSKLTGNGPLILLIDDLQYADPASLEMLRELLLDDGQMLLICATASKENQNIPQAVPLDLFRTAYSEPLGMVEITLTPLTDDDIRKFINIIFPGISMPKDLAGKLADITQGNPLFIGAILRKMITDQKIVQSEHQWTVIKLEKGYFPRSFEEIIREKLECFKGESKDFLDRASAFGESTSLSMLAGFSEQNSTEIYDILKEAVDQGIVRSEFEDNDENIRFSSRRIQEAIYEGILPEDRKALHEKIGLYHEKLYHQDLLPSAAFLVHHFKLSDNEEKARNYEQLMTQFNQRIYDLHDVSIEADEAGGEEETALAEAEEIASIPLSDDALRHVPYFLKAFIVAIRNTRLYPPESKSVTGAAEKLMDHTRAILASDERFSIIIEKNLLLVNGQILDTSTFQSVAEKVTDLWNRLELKSLTFRKGASEDELRAVLFKMSQIERKTITPGFWQRFAEENNLTHILLRQVKYTKIDQGADFIKQQVESIGTARPGNISTEAGEFDESELFAIQRVMGTLLGAYSKLKLYPAEGPVAQNAVNHVLKELRAFLKHWPVLSIARVENALLINGTKVDTSSFEALASGFMKLLKDTGLSSMSFTSRISVGELVDFISTATQSPPDSMDAVFWQKMAAQKQITGILFDQGVYGIIEPRTGAADTEIEEETAAEKEPEARPPEGHAFDDSDLDTLPDRIMELYLNGEIRQAEALVKRLAEKYKNLELEGKIRIISVFDAILIPENWRPNAAFIKLILNPVMALFESEKQPEPIRRLFDLGHRCGERFILFGEYLHAAWVYSRLRQQPLYEKPAGNPTASQQAQILGKSIDPKATDALTQDLASDNRTRQQDAYQLISSLGAGMLPLLISIVKNAENLRVRQLTAELIKSIGQPGVERLKQSIMETSRPDERARILDVIDTVTGDLVNELAYVFTDTNEGVRRSAFRLAERLNSPEVVELLVDYARSEERHLAVFAINTLGRIKPPSLIATLSLIIDKSDDAEVLIAACRAMGQTGDAASVDPLSRILIPRRRFLRRKKYDTPVRVAAAYALAQIQGDRANAILLALKEDADTRVRQVVSRYHTDKS